MFQLALCFQHLIPLKVRLDSVQCRVEEEEEGEEEEAELKMPALLSLGLRYFRF